MAIISSNNLGRIRNKSGPHVFRKWRTLSVMAVYTAAVSNPRTLAQRIQRLCFGVLAGIGRYTSAAINIGFAYTTRGTRVPARSRFMSVNSGNVTSADGETYTVDYEDLKFSEGAMPSIQFGNAVYDNPLEVGVPISDSATVQGADRNDIAYVLVLNQQTGESMMGSGVRVDEEVVVHVPAAWNGNTVHVYGFGKSVSDMFEGQCSKTHYLGSGQIS